MEIGAQLYTVRNHCKTLDAFAESLARIANIGYKNIQISGTCEFEPEWVKNELKKNGLKCVVTHTSADKLKESAKKVAIEHDIFGTDYIGLGYFNFTASKDIESLYKEFLDIFLPVARTVCECGKHFMFHNHDKEFQKINGIPILYKLAEDFTSDEMGFIIDTFWVQAGGADPAYVIEKFSGRVPCIHLKDYAYGQKMSALGEGNINFDRIFKTAEASGTKYMLVEQDDCNGEDPFDCLQRSYEYLRGFGFE